MTRGQAKLLVLSYVERLLTIGNTYWQKLVVTFEKSESSTHFIAGVTVSFYVGYLYCIVAYKHDEAVVIK